MSLINRNNCTNLGIRIINICTILVALFVQTFLLTIRGNRWFTNDVVVDIIQLFSVISQRIECCFLPDCFRGFPMILLPVLSWFIRWLCYELGRDNLSGFHQYVYDHVIIIIPINADINQQQHQINVYNNVGDTTTI